MAPVSVCECGEPLICTFLFDGYEYYCLCCGRKYGWLEPKTERETAELLARQHELEVEFAPLASDIINPSAQRRDCGLCRDKGEPHAQHATEEERARSSDALAQLRARAASGQAAA